MIPRLAEANDDDDRKVFSAGRLIAAGSGDRQDFLAIFEGKTRAQTRPRPARDSNAEITGALDLSMAAGSERAALAVLTASAASRSR
jgi:hypothetical protein